MKQNNKKPLPSKTKEISLETDWIDVIETMRETNESPKSQNPSEEATTVNELSCEAKPKLLFTPTKSSLSIGNFPYKEFDPVLKFPGIHYTYSRERLWGTCVILSTLFWSYYVLSNSELLEFEASEYSLLFILIIALDALLTVSLFGKL